MLAVAALAGAALAVAALAAGLPGSAIVALLGSAALAALYAGERKRRAASA